jgi:hypothetical protein
LSILFSHDAQIVNVIVLDEVSKDVLYQSAYIGPCWLPDTYRNRNSVEKARSSWPEGWFTLYDLTLYGPRELLDDIKLHHASAWKVRLVSGDRITCDILQSLQIEAGIEVECT